MTKREIIYLVLERLNARSDDSNPTEELVSSLIDVKRSMILKQRFSKAQWNIPIELRQEICMDVSLYDVISGYSGAGKILKTNNAVPSAIKIKGFSGPIMIRKEDGSSIPFNLIPIERLPYIGDNRYTAMLTYATLDLDGRIILISKDEKLKFLKQIRVTDLFEKPDEAYNLECKDNNMSGIVEPWDITYPVESAMIDDIVKLVVQDLAKSLSIPEDKVNNADGGR